MNGDEIRAIVARVMEELSCAVPQPSVQECLPMEISARHVHLSAEDLEQLFGKGYQLTVKRNLSQPGEFLSNERVKLVTAKGCIEHVAVLGPVRQKTQVELSATDARQLGVKAPVNLSGNLQGAADLLIVSEQGAIYAKQCGIIAQAHVHMTPEDAQRFGVQNGQVIHVRALTKRPVTFENIVVRVSPKFKLAVHLDYDEANCCCMDSSTKGQLIRAQSDGSSVVVQQIPMTQAPQQPEPKPALPEEKLITEAVAIRLLSATGQVVRLRKGTLVTPSARDVFRSGKKTLEFV